MNRKTIDDVRAELHRVKSREREQHDKDVKRAELAEREAIKQRARADAYEGAVVAMISDMKRLGFAAVVNPTARLGDEEDGKAARVKRPTSCPRCGGIDWVDTGHPNARTCLRCGPQ